jgi:CBS domain-containing protein
MLVSTVLTDKGRTVITVTPEVSVRSLLRTLEHHNIGAAVVSLDGRHPAGMVSERDVARRLAHDGPAVLEGPVSAISTPVREVCREDDSIERLMDRMTGARVRHLPVLDTAGQLVGLVSIGDVVHASLTETRIERDELRRYVTS